MFVVVYPVWPTKFVFLRFTVLFLFVFIMYKLCFSAVTLNFSNSKILVAMRKFKSVFANRRKGFFLKLQYSEIGHCNTIRPTVYCSVLYIEGRGLFF